ncbi:chorismate mutase [Saccharothrix luteola]|uniref:chorismate mutase n=1 Tax=Saccharothrix luteola TaxID=2893018 RepID=UPI0022A83719|nr:chorismate mutase [Saccharothrix luteola]
MNRCAWPTSSFFTGTGLRLPWTASADKPPRSPGVLGPRGFAAARAGTPTRVERSSPMNSTEAAPDIDALRQEIDHLDAELLRLVKRRVEVSKIIGAARMAAGGTRIVHNREIDVINRYKDLGPDGRDLAMILLKLGRGHLGR